MAREFVTARYPEGEMPRTQTQSQMIGRIRAFIREGEKARMREVGSEWSGWRKQSVIVDKVILRVDRMGVGPKLIVQRQNDREMLSIRELSSVPDLGAAPAIEEIHAAVWDRFDVRSGGLWLCRNIDGTSTVSKHGYLTKSWKGAAEDVFIVSPNTMAGLVDVAEFVVNETKRGRLKAATVIVDQDIWTPGSGWRVYPGQRHFHGHFDVLGGSPCNP